MDALETFLQSYFQLDTERQVKLLETAFVLLTLFVLRFIINFLLKLNLRHRDPNEQYSWQKMNKYIFFLLAVFLLAGIWFQEVNSLATYLGLLSAGLAFALADVLGNMAGWLFIITRQPFRVGERIQIGRDQGDVVDIRMFEFTIAEIGNWVDADQSTGRLVHIPNRFIFRESLANYTRHFPYIWHEIPVQLTLESDWRTAKDLLTQVLNRQVSDVVTAAERKTIYAQKKFSIKYGKLTPIVYTDVDLNGIRLTMRFLVDARQRRGATNRIWEDVLDTFATQPTIQITYRPQRIVGDLLTSPTSPDHAQWQTNR
ncbi:MAG: mechanosensitive ion channel [Anaerolineales bacterium]|nr:mechanosensitive ion channel [Anaerolineales bacterium]